MRKQTNNTSEEPSEKKKKQGDETDDNNNNDNNDERIVVEEEDDNEKKSSNKKEEDERRMTHGKELFGTIEGGVDGSANTVMTLPATVSQCSLTSSIYSNPRRPPPLAVRRRQVQLLGGLSGVSFMVVIVSCLNGLALLSLSILIGSMILFVPVGMDYLQLQYQQNPRLFYDMLPSSVQSYLTSTTLHEWMTSTEGSPYMEYRYLLLYFIPGLTESQLHHLLSRLPPRHRDLLFQPGGVARILLPPSLYTLLSPPPPSYPESSFRQEEEEEEEPTVQDAIRGILGTVRELFPNYSSPSLQQPIHTNIITTTNTAITPIVNDMTWEEEEYESDTDNVIVQPPPTTVNAVLHTSHTEEEEGEEDDDSSTRRHQQYQEEYATEEAILTDAISATLTNYANAASEYVRDTIESTLVSMAPRIIRNGLGLSFFSTIGWFGSYRLMTTTTRPATRSQRMVHYSFMATSIMGTASAGMAYMARSWIRNKRNKRKQLNNNDDDDDEPIIPTENGKKKNS